jgi:hypothetical protein
MDEIGARNQPLTRAAWFKIGKEIKKSAALAHAYGGQRIAGGGDDSEDTYG